MSQPQKKIAVVMTHGMGEQIPMETLRGFVQTAWVENTEAHWDHLPPKEKSADIWFTPGDVAGSFELRRITTRHTDSEKTDPATGKHAKGPRVDFFEFYWADLTEGTTAHEVTDWVSLLLFRGDVPARLKPA